MPIWFAAELPAERVRDLRGDQNDVALEFSQGFVIEREPDAGRVDLLGREGNERSRRVDDTVLLDLLADRGVRRYEHQDLALDLLKILAWDGQGLVLVAKRLERGRFVWPQATSGVVSLTPAMLSMLLEGIDWRMPAWTARPEVVG